MKQLRPIFLSAVMAMCTLQVCAAVHAQEMPAGKWQITTKIEMPGMPADMAAKMGSQVSSHCVLKGKSKWADEQSLSAQRSCERTETKIVGNEVTWKMKCKEGITGTGQVNHNGKDAYTMKLNMLSPRGMMKMQSEGKLVSPLCDTSK